MAACSTLKSRTNSFKLLIDYYNRLIKGQSSRADVSRILGVVTLIISIIGTSYGYKRWNRKYKAEKAHGRRLLRRNSALRGNDGSRHIYVPYRQSSAKVIIHATKATTFDAHRRLFLNPPRAAGLQDDQSLQSTAQGKAGIGLGFLHQFLSLLSIMIPRWHGKEAGLLLSQGVFLMLRTYLSLVVARLDGAIVRDLVAGNGRGFTWGIIKWCGIGGLASYTNAAIKFLQNKVSIAFRTRLTRYIHDLYLNDNLNYYKLAALDGGVGQGADQFITQDLTLFCDAAASLYSSIGKPFVDLCVFNYQLYHSLGPLALTGLLGNYVLTAALLRQLSPPFGKLKSVEGRREGDFRGLHSRLITNAEEVAFYGGADIEKAFLDKGFRELRLWMEGIYKIKIRYNMLEDFILKYSWSAFGYLISSLPVFFPAWGGVGGDNELQGIDSGVPRETDRMKSFITNKRLMLSLADAGGRIMYSIKDLSELAGYTSRIYTLLSMLHRTHASAYTPARGVQAGLFSLSDVQGTLQKGFDGIRLEYIPVVAPSIFPMGGEEILEPLSFVISPGEHLLVSGPNGVGKSAVARILAGLWPVYRGLVSRPRRIGADGIIFLPQRPYLSVGTLRDQIIYPHSELDMRESGMTDEDLNKVLEDVRLGYLPDREGGYDTQKTWKDILSGGEKQRVSLARVFYHEPRFAILDEATSAVSSDVESLLYERAKERGITIITLSTRASLKKHHIFNLNLGTGEDGSGWVFERIGTEAEKMEVERELQELRTKLSKVEEWKLRREDIDNELSRVWIRDDNAEQNSSSEFVPASYGNEGVGEH